MNSSSQQLLPAATGQHEDRGTLAGRAGGWRLPGAPDWPLSSTVPCQDWGLPPPRGRECGSVRGRMEVTSGQTSWGNRGH